MSGSEGCCHVPLQQEAESNLRKAKQMYMQRSEEHEKAKSGTVKAEEEQQAASSTAATKALDKRRRLEEEARNKVGRRLTVANSRLGWEILGDL